MIHYIALTNNPNKATITRRARQEGGRGTGEGEEEPAGLTTHSLLCSGQDVWPGRWSDSLSTCWLGTTVTELVFTAGRLVKEKGIQEQSAHTE